MTPTPQLHLTGNARVYFVIADPIAQVKAQVLFNHVFGRAGVDAVVVPMQVRAERLQRFVDEAFAVPNVGGLFVSIPHKSALVPMLARVDDEAAAAGAVNAVRRGADGRLEGALFDGTGCVAAMAHHGIRVAGRRVLVVGTGGAGSAIACALAKAGAAAISLFDADPARAAALRARLAALGGTPVEVQVDCDPGGQDVIVQATPLGLRETDPLPLDPARLASHAALFDILMTRAPTPLVRACRARGLVAEAGQEMLVQQVPAYLGFFGHAAVAAPLRAPGQAQLAELRSLITPADGVPTGASSTPFPRNEDRRLPCA
ncbi:MAG: shikimate dehydrogenase [Acidobacteria bacterium]|nr:shikimate dehydrogenase [Acidobacteriota bacterium]